MFCGRFVGEKISRTRREGEKGSERNNREKESRIDTDAVFVLKFYSMLIEIETKEKEGFNKLLRWSKGGKSFEIRNSSKFAKEVLPLYYKHK